MQIKTKCMVCQNKLATNSCMLCGSFVCNDCYNKTEKLCINCSGSRNS